MKCYTQYTDDELLAFLRARNRDAFNEIYRRYWKKMLLVAWNHSKDKYIAKDIVQDVFVDLWQKYSTTDIQSLAAFLATAVKFRVFKHYQKELRRSELAKLNYKLNDILLEEDNIDARFLQDYINGIVEELPERSRLVFRLSRNAGLSNAEIAEQIGITEKGVEKALTRALKIIRFELKDHGILLVVISRIFYLFLR